jgi:hypothetical protein
MAEEFRMPSLPDCAPSPVPLSPPALDAQTARPLRTWYFIGTTLFGSGVFAVQQLAQLAILIVLFIWSGAEPLDLVDRHPAYGEQCDCGRPCRVGSAIG